LKNKHFENHTRFIYLIKGIVLGWTLWGANTFPTRNRLPNPKSDFHRPVLSHFRFFP